MLTAQEIGLARALERGDVPGEGFPHVSHLRVAWVYLTECASLDEAVARMAATLRAFAASVGKAEKYSEPTTVFWMRQLAAARAAVPGAGFNDVLCAYPRLLDKNLMRPEPTDVPAAGPADSPSDAPYRPLSGRTP